MNVHPAISEIAKELINSPQREAVHQKIKARVADLCQNREFLHEAIKGSISRPGFLCNTTDLTIHLEAQGDVMININLFVPTRDKARLITQDNIHHHGWRQLTTGIISGEGYDTIQFVPNTHNNRIEHQVLLEVEDCYRHAPGDVRYIAENQAHVVFQPDSTTATLAIWSADKPMTGQTMKRSLQGFPRVRKIAAKAIRAAKVEKLFGVNKTRGLYYYPFEGQIRELNGYRKPYDGTNQEMLNCMFRFFQQVDFTENEFWSNMRNQVSPHVIPWIEKLLESEPIRDTGIWGHPRRRFTRTQILQAIDNEYMPPDVES